MSTNNDLILNDNTKIKCLEKSHKHFLNKTTIIYGRTASGKSTIIDEIMYLCKDYIPIVFVISPTNSSNNAYTNKIPCQFIKKKLDVIWLDKLLNRQKNSSSAYINANKIEILKKLFDKVCETDHNNLEQLILDKSSDSIKKIDESELNFSEKNKQKKSVIKDTNNILKNLYKSVIRIKKDEFSFLELNKSEKIALSFLDFNPNVMLILDDCASTFKKLYKSSTAIKEIFYEGRHYFFTTIISAQDDKEIDSELRKNTTVSFFTTSQAATSNFERASNGYPKEERNKARDCTETVFNKPTNEPNYKKLVYIQGDPEPFRYTKANLYDEFKMCSSVLWKYSDIIKPKNEISNNPFFDKYV